VEGGQKDNLNCLIAMWGSFLKEDEVAEGQKALGKVSQATQQLFPISSNKFTNSTKNLCGKKGL
jgi:hypothetical protein